MSTYYSEVVSDDEVRKMFDEVFAAAERGFCHDTLARVQIGLDSGEEISLRHRYDMCKVSCVREIVDARLSTFRGDEFKSLGPVQDLAALKTGIKEADNG